LRPPSRSFGRIDALINNAGMSAQALLEEVKAEDLAWYEHLMRINLWGSVWCTHAALPHLKASRGHIVAVSSLAGLVGVPGRTAYSATKFAMTGFFEALRAELKGGRQRHHRLPRRGGHPDPLPRLQRGGPGRRAQRPEGRRRHERGGMRAADHRRHATAASARSS
jgi:hypothetical protein